MGKSSFLTPAALETFTDTAKNRVCRREKTTNGRIEVTSRRWQGTTFAVVLPLIAH